MALEKMRVNNYKILASTIVLSSITFVSCKEIHGEAILDPIQTLIEGQGKEMLRDSTVNSVSIVILKDGKEYINHFGELDRGKGNAPTDETIYEIASVTKTFTGMLMAKAVLDKRINLEDDIRIYLKEEFPNLEYEGHPLKIKHLITHTARLPYVIKEFEKLLKTPDDSLVYKAYRIYDKSNKQEYFKDLHNQVIDTLPGTKFKYSNVGANLAGHILENVYEREFSKLLDDFIFSKADLKSTKTKLNEMEETRLANGYDGKGRLMPHLPLHRTLWGAEGSIKTTAIDMIKYMHFQLSIDNPIVKESHKKFFKVDEENWIGYFWMISTDKNSKDYYRHNGGAFGSQNTLYIFPSNNTGVQVITNSSSADASKSLSEVCEKLIIGLDLK